MRKSDFTVIENDGEHNQQSVIFSDTTEYKRDLGLLEASSIVVSRIIGSGIFRTPGPIMAAVMCTSLFGFVWFLGGIITIFAAVCYAELVAFLPRTGGPYVYLKNAYGPLVAFLRGWAMFFVSETAAIAAVAIDFSDYLNSLWGISFGVKFPGSIEIAIALMIIWLLTFINLFGVYLSGIFQNIFTIVKIIAVVSIIGFCFTAKGNWNHFVEPLWPTESLWGSIGAIAAACRLAFFAFSGWEGATYIAEEVKNPRRNLPLSLLIGITCVMILFFAANAAYLYQLPVETFINEKSKWIAAEAMQAAWGVIGAIVISAAVMTSAFSNVSTQILVKARSWQAMAADGLFFKPLKELHPVYKTPNKALIVQGVWASILLLLSASAKDTYSTLIDFFFATGAVFNILTLCSVAIFRKRYPDAVRTYSAWFYPVSLIVVVAVYAALLVISVITEPVSSLMGLLLTSTGLIYYYFMVYKVKINEGKSTP